MEELVFGYMPMKKGPISAYDFDISDDHFTITFNTEGLTIPLSKDAPALLNQLAQLLKKSGITGVSISEDQTTLVLRLPNAQASAMQLREALQGAYKEKGTTEEEMDWSKAKPAVTTHVDAQNRRQAERAAELNEGRA